MNGVRWLNTDDLRCVSYTTIADQVAAEYTARYGRKHTYGARDPDAVRIHWSREWEYPYAVIASEIKRGDTLLDLGCGGSPLDLWLSRSRGVRVIGMDIEDVEVGAPSLRSFGGPASQYGVSVVRHDLTVLPWPIADHSVDVITCLSVLESVVMTDETLVSFVHECCRVLNAGGRLVVTVDIGRDCTFDTRDSLLAWGSEPLRFTDANRFQAEYILREVTVSPTVFADDYPGTYHVLGVCLKNT